jgi:hypothetical protein
MYSLGGTSRTAPRSRPWSSTPIATSPAWPGLQSQPTSGSSPPSDVFLYRFDERAVIALYSNTASKKDLPAFEITNDGFLGEFLAADTEDLKRECRKRAPEDLEAVIAHAKETH